MLFMSLMGRKYVELLNPQADILILSSHLAKYDSTGLWSCPIYTMLDVTYTKDLALLNNFVEVKVSERFLIDMPNFIKIIDVAYLTKIFGRAFEENHRPCIRYIDEICLTVASSLLLMNRSN